MTDPVVRPARADDMPWILGTWANSHGSRLARRQRSQLPAFRAFMRDILASSPTLAVIATGDGLSTLHAWACATPGEALHYVYVPRELRRQGLAARVIRAAFGAYPERIRVTYRWPFESTRFIFQPWQPPRLTPSRATQLPASGAGHGGGVLHGADIRPEAEGSAARQLRHR